MEENYSRRNFFKYAGKTAFGLTGLALMSVPYSAQGQFDGGMTTVLLNSAACENSQGGITRSRELTPQEIEAEKLHFPNLAEISAGSIMGLGIIGAICLKDKFDEWYNRLVNRN